MSILYILTDLMFFFFASFLCVYFLAMRFRFYTLALILKLSVPFRVLLKLPGNKEIMILNLINYFRKNIFKFPLILCRHLFKIQGNQAWLNKSLATTIAHIISIPLITLLSMWIYWTLSIYWNNSFVGFTRMSKEFQWMQEKWLE